MLYRLRYFQALQRVISLNNSRNLKSNPKSFSLPLLTLQFDADNSGHETISFCYINSFFFTLTDLYISSYHFVSTQLYGRCVVRPFSSIKMAEKKRIKSSENF